MWYYFAVGSLQIRQSLESDEGRYECVAENSVGIAYSHEADLYVRGTRSAPLLYTVTVVVTKQPIRLRGRNRQIPLLSATRVCLQLGVPCRLALVKIPPAVKLRYLGSGVKSFTTKFKTSSLSRGSQ